VSRVDVEQEPPRFTLPELTLQSLAGDYSPTIRLKAAHEIGVALKEAAAEWADRLELEHVRACRKKGVSWKRIGETLGVTQQHARRRFAKRI